MGQRVDVAIGTRFGSLVVTGDAFAVRTTKERLHFPCRCDCGRTISAESYSLRHGSPQSCGCQTGALKGAAHTKHGQSKRGEQSRLYGIWRGMLTRCYNDRRREYAHYGARGITVCDAWREDFAAFAQWSMANGYDDTREIDRTDNDAGYSAYNCRWVTRGENLRNTRQNRFITAFGETRCLTDWALDSRCSVSPDKIRRRIERLGWTPEAAITTPRLTKRDAPRFRGRAA